MCQQAENEARAMHWQEERDDLRSEEARGRADAQAGQPPKPAHSHDEYYEPWRDLHYTYMRGYLSVLGCASEEYALCTHGDGDVRLRTRIRGRVPLRRRDRP